MGGLIHVGAWTGEEYVGDSRRLLLFEPQAGAFKTLRRNLAGNPAAVLVNCALGSEPGAGTMFTANPSHSSSLLEPQQWQEVEFEGTETVKVSTLDMMMERFGLTGYDELVVDTQGYELEVLKGARKTLRHINRIECEFHDPTTYPGAASPGEVDSYLAPLGFERTSGSDGLGDATYRRVT